MNVHTTECPLQTKKRRSHVDPPFFLKTDNTLNRSPGGGIVISGNRDPDRPAAQLLESTIRC